MVVMKNKGESISIITNTPTYGGGLYNHVYGPKDYTSVHITDEAVIVYDRTDILAYLNRDHVISVHFGD